MYVVKICIDFIIEILKSFHRACAALCYGSSQVQWSSPWSITAFRVKSDSRMWPELVYPLSCLKLQKDTFCHPARAVTHWIFCNFRWTRVRTNLPTYLLTMWLTVHMCLETINKKTEKPFSLQGCAIVMTSGTRLDRTGARQNSRDFPIKTG